MNYKGHSIDPVKFWSNYTDVKEAPGPFLPLCFCPNPDHNNTRSPAFQINISKPFVHCFSHCGISGTYEHALCVIEELYDKWKVDEADSKIIKKQRQRRAWNEARRIILQKSVVARIVDPVRLQKNSEKAKPKKAPTEIDLGKYSYFPKEALKYLDERGISVSSRIRWRIGFNEETNRVTVPVFDKRQRLRFILERAIDKKNYPPWLVPSEEAKSSLLFGACNLDEALVHCQGLIVVEGAFDAIRLHQHGHKNTVAVLGSYISQKQKEEIARFRPTAIYMFFDQDIPAKNLLGIDSAYRQFSGKYPIRIPLYPKSKNELEFLDPAKLTKEQADRAIEKAVPYLVIKKRIRERKVAMR